MGFTILGTGSALPKRRVSNDELSEFLDTSDEWIFTRTGIKSRHVCTTESLDDLAVAASEQALQTSGIDASQLDLIVCSTTTGDHLVPAEAAPLLSAWVPHVLPSTFRRLVPASYLRSMSPRAISPAVVPGACLSLLPSR